MYNSTLENVEYERVAFKGQLVENYVNGFQDYQQVQDIDYYLWMTASWGILLIAVIMIGIFT